MYRWSIVVIILATCSWSCQPQKPGNLILLITVDSLRADHLGVSGHPKNISREIDHFAQQATRYTRAFTNCSWTKPAMVSMLSGHIPSEHLVVSSALQVHLHQAKLAASDPVKKALFEGIIAHFDRVTRIPADMPLFHESLEGYTKAAFVNNPHLHESYGFNRGWDHFSYYPSKAFQQGRIFSVTPEMTRDIMKFLDRHVADDVFLWVHFNDVHYPYGPAQDTLADFWSDPLIPLERYDIAAHEQLSRRAVSDPRAVDFLHALYCAGIKTFDAHLGHLFEELRARDRWDSAMVLLTSDHGEEFLEHGSMGHGFNLYNPCLHIPLLVKMPHQVSPATSSRLTSLADIGGMIVDCANGAGSQGARTDSGDSTENADPVVAELLSMNLEHYEALVAPSVKLIVDVNRESFTRFDLERDPDERAGTPVTSTDPLAQVLDRRRGPWSLLERLEGEAASEFPSHQDDEGVIEDLKSLGYIR